MPLVGIWAAGKVPEAVGTEQRVPPSVTRAGLSLFCSVLLPWPGAGSLRGVRQGLLRRVVVKPVES